EAQPTLAVVQPSGLTPEAAVAPTSAPAPTVDAPVAPTVAPTAGSSAAASGEFVLNGVTLPYARNETIVMDQTDYSVFDSFNMYIPNGNEFASGYRQQVIEFLWYANYVTGEITPWLATGYSYNDEYTQLTLNIRPGVTWNDGQPFPAD